MKFQKLKDEKNKTLGSFFLLQDKTKDEEKISYQKYLSTHDSLTGVYNKFYFFEQAQKILQNNKNNEYVMICTKISNFKFINEIFDSVKR